MVQVIFKKRNRKPQQFYNQTLHKKFIFSQLLLLMRVISLYGNQVVITLLFISRICIHKSVSFCVQELCCLLLFSIWPVLLLYSCCSGTTPVGRDVSTTKFSLGLIPFSVLYSRLLPLYQQCLDVSPVIYQAYKVKGCE